MPQALRRRSPCVDARYVLLRCFVHLIDRFTDLPDADALLRTSVADFRDENTHSLNRLHDLRVSDFVARSAHAGANRTRVNTDSIARKAL
ncbi:hypothetical protein [Paraburkholderia sp. BR14374]|uniref:hypothetical protein n=1 Tax=Paraburkholderia sp. BR14374 TaxID=3237007 RepID=UPI0034CF9D49